MERRAVLQLRIEPFPPERGRRLGRIVSPQGLHLRLGEAVPHIFPVKPLPTGRIRGVFHAGAVDLPDIDPAAGADQLRRQPRVVAVRLRQLALHGLAAGLLAEARVDQQAPLSGQQIAVQVFQRVPHQGDVQPPEVLRQSLRHGPLPFQKVDSV